MEAIDSLRMFLTDYPSLQYVAVFLGAAFGAEVAMIALGFLIAYGFFHIPTFFVVSFAGVYFTDTIWFLLGRTELMNKFLSHRYTNGTVVVISEAVHRVSKGNNFIVLLLANFVLACRIILIVYVSKTGIHFKRFLFYEAIAAVFWILVTTSIGFLSGLGFTYLAEIFQSVYAGVGFLLLIFIIVVIIQVWLKKRITKNSGANEETITL